MEGVLRRLSSGRQRCRYKTYPHVDYVERAAEATRLIAGMINKTCRPTMAATKPPKGQYNVYAQRDDDTTICYATPGVT